MSNDEVRARVAATLHFTTESASLVPFDKLTTALTLISLPSNDSHLLLVDWRVNPPAAAGFCSSGNSDPPANREERLVD